MIKVYENFDFSRVGQMQSLLESHGIGTFIRNQYGSSVMGEVPFVEVVPQLYVLRERDVDRAIELFARAGLLDDPVQFATLDEFGLGLPAGVAAVP